MNSINESNSASLKSLFQSNATASKLEALCNNVTAIVAIHSKGHNYTRTTFGNLHQTEQMSHTSVTIGVIAMVTIVCIIISAHVRRARHWRQATPDESTPELSARERRISRYKDIEIGIITKRAEQHDDLCEQIVQHLSREAGKTRCIGSATAENGDSNSVVFKQEADLPELTPANSFECPVCMEDVTVGSFVSFL
jgi:putative lipoic acid-binding regulatory protein